MNYCSLQRSKWCAFPRGPQEVLLYVPMLEESSESFKAVLGSDALNWGEVDSGVWKQMLTFIYQSLFSIPKQQLSF